MTKVQNYTYHCHTVMSDGRNTAEEMIAQAAKLGFSEIGITDHLYLNAKMDVERLRKAGFEHIYNSGFEEARIKTEKYVATIKAAAEKYSINVLIGYEVDFFDLPGWNKNLQKLKDDFGLDYLISGNHFTVDKEVGSPIFVTSAENYTKDKNKRQELISNHLLNIVAAVESKLFDFIAHIDFVRWGGICGEFDNRDEKMAIIEALAKNNIPTEINTKGYRSIGDFYPAKWLIEEMKIRKIPLIISDDAHSVGDIGYCFVEAEKMLEDMDYKYRFDLKSLIR